MELPSNAPTNGWYNILPAPGPAVRLTGRLRVPWVVVGAGVTGLAAARQLATHFPQQQIALVDAERIGFGTSGRNSGFVLDQIFLSTHPPARNLAVAQRRMRLCDGGLNALKRLVSQHDIDCDWHEWGKLHVAAVAEGNAGLERQIQGLQTLNVPYRFMDGDEVAAITGSQYYGGGLKTQGTALVNPAALCRGLARSLPENVTVFEQTPVHDLVRGQISRLVSKNGEILADQVIICANAFSPTLGIARNAIVPAVVYASLTRPLTTSEQAKIGGEAGGFGLLPISMNGSTIQRTPHGRILVRNTVGYGPADTSSTVRLAAARSNHAASLVKRWPSLNAGMIEHTWGGLIGVARNQGHLFGRLDRGLWASAACNGVYGMSGGTMAGILIADLIAGKSSDLLSDQLEIPKPSWLPPEPFLSALFRLKNSALAAAVQSGARKLAVSH